MGEGKRLLVATVLTAWVICTQAQQLQPLAIASSAGGNASLPCSANYTNPYKLIWLRLWDTHPTAIMRKSKDVISTDMPEKYKLETSMTLRISNLNESDVGKYYCTYTTKTLSTITDEPITLFITDVPMSGCETGSDEGGCDCVVDGDAAEDVTFTAKGFPQKPYVSLTDEEGNPLRVHEGIAMHVQPDDITAPSWAFNPSHLLEGRNGTLFLRVSNDIYFPSGSTLSLLETKTICTSRNEVPVPANGTSLNEKLWALLVIPILAVLLGFFLCMWKKQESAGKYRVSLTQVIPSSVIISNEEAQAPTRTDTEEKGHVETARNEFDTKSEVSSKMEEDQSDGTSKHVNNETSLDDQEGGLPLAGTILLADICSASDERKKNIKARVVHLVEQKLRNQELHSTASGSFIGKTSLTACKSRDPDLHFVHLIMKRIANFKKSRDRARAELMITTHLWLDQSENSLSKRSSEMSNPGFEMNASNNSGAGDVADHLVIQIIDAMKDKEGMDKYRRLIPSIILRAFNEAQSVDSSYDELSRSFTTPNSLGVEGKDEVADQTTRLAMLWVTMMMDHNINIDELISCLFPEANQVQPGSSSQPSQPSNDSAEPLLQASN